MRKRLLSAIAGYAVLLSLVAVGSAPSKATIKGKVVYQSSPPKARIINPTEKKCQAHLKGKPIPAEDMVVKGGAVKWVIVHVKDGVRGKFSPPKTPVVLDQQGIAHDG